MNQILDEEERKWAEEESKILQASGINAQVFNAMNNKALSEGGGTKQ